MNSFLAALNMRPFLAGSGTGVQALRDGVAMELSASSGGLQISDGVSTRAPVRHSMVRWLMRAVDAAQRFRRQSLGCPSEHDCRHAHRRR
jgi:hypothetical protein